MNDPIIVKQIGFQDPPSLQKTIHALGIRKSKLPWYKQFLLSWQSGFYLGLVCGCCIRCVGNNPFLANNPGLGKMIFALLFPVGLMIIVLNGFELITGNMAVYIPGLLTRQIAILRLLKCWGLVYLGNFAGSLTAVGLFIYVAKIFDGTPWEAMAIKIAEDKMNLDWGTAVLRGITCNMFVVIAVFQAVMSNSVLCKVIAVWPPLFAFVALGLEHSVANMSLLPLGIFYGVPNRTFGDFIWRNLIPVTIGNFIGASFLVGAMSWVCHGEWPKRSDQMAEQKPEEKPLQKQEQKPEQKEESQKKQEKIETENINQKPLETEGVVSTQA